MQRMYAGPVLKHIRKKERQCYLALQGWLDFMNGRVDEMPGDPSSHVRSREWREGWRKQTRGLLSMLCGLPAPATNPGPIGFTLSNHDPISIGLLPALCQIPERQRLQSCEICSALFWRLAPQRRPTTCSQKCRNALYQRDYYRRHIAEERERKTLEYREKQRQSRIQSRRHKQLRANWQGKQTSI
jgi:hypothetical protein